LPPCSARPKGSKFPFEGFPDQTFINLLILLTMLTSIEHICPALPADKRFKKTRLNRLNNLKFVWAVVMIFLMTYLPGCKSVTSAENIGNETRSAIPSEKESEERMETQQRNRFSGHGKLTEIVETLTKTIVIQDKVLKSSTSPVPIIIATGIGWGIRRLARDSRQSSTSDPRRMSLNPAGIAVFFCRQIKNSPTVQTQQPDCLDQTARLLRPNSPTVQTKQPDCLNETPRLFYLNNRSAMTK